MSPLKLFFFLFLVPFALRSQSTLMRGEVIAFDAQNFAQARIAEDGSIPSFYRLAHFSQIPTSKQRARLEAKGVQFLEYYLNATYLVAFKQPVSEELCRSIGMDGLVTIPTAAKLSPKVKERPIPSWAKGKNDQVKIIVEGYKNTLPSVFVKWIQDFGVQVDFSGRHECYVEVTTSTKNIELLAALPGVSFIDWINPPDVLDDDNGRAMHRSNVLDSHYPGGRHYDGTGVKVLVRDDGSVGPHIDFTGRVNQDDPTTNGGGSHGDMVAGILTGAGNLEPTYKGMAPGAELFVRDYNSEFQTYTLDLHLNENVLVTSSSYSNGCNAGYTAVTHTIDQQIYENPTLVHIFSAGNNGSGDCGYGIEGWGNITGGHKQGKNAIATGNLEKDIQLRSSSSRGPAYDGRIKPDICAHGHLQMSTDPNNDYSPGGGTSAASPGTAGVFTQLIQAYKSLYGGAIPKSGLIKACLLNTAIDLGNVGPDFKHGWGELNGYRAVKLLENGDFLTSSIDQGQNQVHIIQVPNGSVQVRFMLYWMDPPAPAYADQALINDLDLKVVSPTGDTILPWVLDPTPNSASLNAPATHGEDHLNNMEQVVFQAPMGGDYQVLVRGNAVPMGPQEYFVLHSAVSDPLFMAFPVGGERFEPGEKVRIFWDAYEVSNEDFTVEYSLDNGVSWNSLGMTNSRSYLWTIPDTPTGKGLVRVSRNGASSQSIYNFSIMARPANLQVDTVCANFAYISWSPVANATDYDLFVLGTKYMDSVGTTSATGIYYPISNPDADFWYSVRARGADGLQSERAYAKYYAGGLKECQVDFDLAVDNLVNISGEDIVQCMSQKIPIIATIRNKGKMPMTNFNVVYSKNNGTPISVPYVGTINAGEIVIWEAMDSLELINTGQYSISLEVIQSDDEILVNNSIAYSFFVENIASSSVTNLEQGFDGTEFPPANWNIIGDDGTYIWAKDESTVGADGMTTSAVWVDNYLYDVPGQITSVESEAVHTDSTGSFKLSFDYSYSNYNDIWSDTLEVVVYDPCDYSAGELQLFYKGGDDLRTIPSVSTSKWHPTSASDWKHEEFVVQGFSDSNVKVKFNNINGYGNSLYLDNILITTEEQGIIVAQTDGCIGDTIEIATDYLGDSLTYQWDFDNGGSIDTTAGPHQIVYLTPGVKNIQLTVTSPSGVKTFNYGVVIVTNPLSGFSYSGASNTVSFTSTSTNATSLLWDFGTGDVSTAPNPVYVFPGSGSYQVCLTVTNACGESTTCHSLDIVTDVQEIGAIFPGIGLAPNPASDFLFIKNRSAQAYSFNYSLMDMTGRQIMGNRSLDLQVGEQYSLDVSNLSSGIYWVKFWTNEKVAFAKIAIE